jgi:transcriptional regulator GlxA family with amidase domain
MHLVGVLALHGVIPFDLALACESFGTVSVPGVPEPYVVRVCGESREVKAGLYDLRVTWDVQQLERANTIIVPGIRQPTMPISDEIVETLRSAARRGVRIASICTGAFVLAAARLLDGKRATTHWRAARELAELHPKVIVDPNVLFVDTGQILTSAGAAAGIDLCLHMIRCDYGAAAAASAARLAVVPLERDGGQAQYIAHEPAATGTTLEPVLRWKDTHLQHRLTLASAARRRCWNRPIARLKRSQRKLASRRPRHCVCISVGSSA